MPSIPLPRDVLRCRIWQVILLALAAECCYAAYLHPGTGAAVRGLVFCVPQFLTLACLMSVRAKHHARGRPLSDSETVKATLREVWRWRHVLLTVALVQIVNPVVGFGVLIACTLRDPLDAAESLWSGARARIASEDRSAAGSRVSQEPAEQGRAVQSR